MRAMGGKRGQFRERVDIIVGLQTCQVALTGGELNR